jgi:periplasmic divalent cation tolerance protein
MEYCIVLSTVESHEEADRIAEVLLEKRLAACVQISPVTSVYRWKGKIERDSEFRLVIKTADELYSKLENLIKGHHSYEVPQIVKLPITDGLAEYLGWIDEETG